jgi:hypothetical protein
MEQGNYIRMIKVGTPHGGISMCPLELSQPDPGAWRGVFGFKRDYWLEGRLLEDVIPDHGIVLDLHMRHGLAAKGIYRSTRVDWIDKDLVAVGDSIWKIVSVSPWTESTLAKPEPCINLATS